jgi:hypothetical protein
MCDNCGDEADAEVERSGECGGNMHLGQWWACWVPLDVKKANVLQAMRDMFRDDSRQQLRS